MMWAAAAAAASQTPLGPKYVPIPKPTKHLLLTQFPTNLAFTSRIRTSGHAAAANQEEGKETISGSDVLWALQRAAAKKKKKKSQKDKRKKKTSSGGGDEDEDGDGVDYDNVRPLEIKTEWSLKLDELEKRLQELEHSTDISL